VSARASTCETLCSFLHKIDWPRGRHHHSHNLPCHLLCHTRYTTVWWGEGERKGEGHLEQLRDVESSTMHRHPHVRAYAQSHTAESMRLPPLHVQFVAILRWCSLCALAPLKTHARTLVVSVWRSVYDVLPLRSRSVDSCARATFCIRPLLPLIDRTFSCTSAQVGVQATE
jgi:hypothetical protein